MVLPGAKSNSAKRNRTANSVRIPTPVRTLRRVKSERVRMGIAATSYVSAAAESTLAFAAREKGVPGVSPSQFAVFVESRSGNLGECTSSFGC